MPSSPRIGAASLCHRGTLPWPALADAVLAGQAVTRGEAMAVLNSPDEELLDVLAAVYRIRRRYFGRKVQLHFLINAKSGHCPEDCHYCSQSKKSTAEIPKYNLLDRAKLLDGARLAAERKAKTYCIVISARNPSERELAFVEKIVPEIKARYPLKICTSLGLLTPEQAGRLKACGVDRINHNLNTSDAFYGKICSTHTYRDRINTLHVVRDAGLEICSGGIVGMGESSEDLVDMAFALRDLNANSIPINYLNPIAGTPLAGRNDLNPRYCLKVLAMFRFVSPQQEIRIAGGREMHLRSLQPLGLYAANSIFIGDYLTTKGQAPELDYQMIRDLGFEIVQPTTAFSEQA
ncbi:MAG: biotin synthase BioB, partial [Pirellulales bacterium]|nr:biotin synthase BioB [Pirellulales bacterium]